jgi:hypothetical protein
VWTSRPITHKVPVVDVAERGCFYYCSTYYKVVRGVCVCVY